MPFWQDSCVLSVFYSDKLPCLNFHQSVCPAVNDAAASPP